MESPSFMIPFGIGVKKILFDKINIGLEFGARKLIKYKNSNSDGFDYVGIYDPVTNAYTSGYDPKLQLINTPQNDQYFYVNIYISYLFFKVHCPKRRF